MPSFSKILLGSVAAGGVGTGGVMTLRHFSSKEESIKEALKGEDIELISSLAIPKAQYELEYESDKDLIKKEINYQGDKKDEGGAKLKEWCDSKILLPSKDNGDLISKIKKWCSIRTVSNQLSRAGKTLLTASSKADNWNKALQEVKKVKKDRTKVGLDGNWDQNTDTNDINTMKTWCTGKGDEKFLATNKESIYDIVESWCSVNTTNYVN
ncbi:hypothetical protein MHF_1397 [Mycoplasma haemofelis Ohio2]|uniref:Uncharacterized protein n=1 Tax=Mycoplasma haemofelis (strain Ohio2) TaxID=859194 RepID=F6FGJ5_MYCHI|nr:hypothetical protein MHF_1397 [Mycoplasma haemofelis Ohio2]